MYRRLSHDKEKTNYSETVIDGPKFKERLE